MTPTIVESIPVSSLYPDRYSIGRTKLYEILGILNIKPFKRGREAHISFAELELLDGYFKALEDGPGTADEYVHEHVPASQLVHAGSSALEQWTQPANDAIAPPQLAPSWEMMIEVLASRLTPPELTDPLRIQEQLSRIAQNNWHATTRQLQEILGIAHWQDQDERYGFRLSKAGKSGRETTWKVSQSE